MSESEENLQDPTANGKVWTPGRVLELRLGRGQSQDAFSRDVGVSRAQVSEWETGKAAVSRMSAHRLTSLAAPPAAPDRLASGISPAPNATPDYWRGVYFAAEAMSETVTQLLRQAREASEAQLPHANMPELRRVAEQTVLDYAAKRIEGAETDQQASGQG